MAPAYLSSRLPSRSSTKCVLVAVAACLAATRAIAEDTVANAPTADVPLVTNPVPEPPPSDKPDWLKRVQVNSATDKTGASNVSVSSVQPLYRLDAGGTVFTAVHIDHNDQAADPSRVSNLGLGYRRLLRDDLLLGVNGYYDRNWALTGLRTGADAEIKWQALDLTANYYRNAAADPTTEQLGPPVPGYDVTVASQLPYLPWARARLGTADAERQLGYSGSMQLGLVQNLQLDVGARDIASVSEDRYASLRFHIGGSSAPDSGAHYLLSGDPVAPVAFQARDLSQHTLDHVSAVDGK